MKKRFIAALMSTAIMGSVVTGCGSMGVSNGVTVDDETPAITEKEMTLYMLNLEDERTHKFYFLGDSDVPYVSLSDWAELMTDIKQHYMDDVGEISFSLKYTKDGDTGVLTREDGSPYTAAFDCKADTITFFDYDAFLRSTDDMALLDLLSDEHPEYFNRLDGTYERYGDQLVLDLGAYGIDMVTEGDECYVPLQTLSDFFLALDYRNIFYNGEEVFLVKYSGLGNTLSGEDYTPLGEKFYSVKPGERSEAMGEYSYAELCLVFDHLYGLKDVHRFESFKRLTEETGFREALMGSDPDQADEALMRIIDFHLDDVHSIFLDTSPSSERGKAMELYQELGFGKSYADLQNLASEYSSARAQFYPDGVPSYEEIGNTAYITFDSFVSPDDANYYDKQPTAKAKDTFGIMLYAYSQIMRENSPIENVVLDLSVNGGGSSDAAIFVLSAFLGEGYASLMNSMTGALTTGVYAVDMNLDKEFNDGDDGFLEKNLYCLISPVSFSCGNLVPNVFKNSNRVTLLGRTSGGGSCAVLSMSIAYGTSFQISGPKRLAFTKNGSFYDIDQGAVPDYSLTKTESFYDRTALSDYIRSLK